MTLRRVRKTHSRYHSNCDPKTAPHQDHEESLCLDAAITGRFYLHAGVVRRFLPSGSGTTNRVTVPWLAPTAISLREPPLRGPFLHCLFIEWKHSTTNSGLCQESFLIFCNFFGKTFHFHPYQQEEIPKREEFFTICSVGSFPKWFSEVRRGTPRCADTYTARYGF